MQILARVSCPRDVKSTDPRGDSKPLGVCLSKHRLRRTHNVHSILKQDRENATDSICDSLVKHDVEDDRNGKRRQR